MRSWPLSSSIIFWGLISRCTTPLAWACSSALRIWEMKCTVSRLESLPPRSLRYSRRVMPSTYSMTIYCRWSLTETSYTLTILGWFSSEIALDSFLKRRTRSGSCIYSCRSTLTATTVPAGTGPFCPRMTALYTLAIPPEPISSCTSYRPSNLLPIRLSMAHLHRLYPHQQGGDVVRAAVFVSGADQSIRQVVKRPAAQQLFQLLHRHSIGQTVRA